METLVSYQARESKLTISELQETGLTYESLVGTCSILELVVRLNDPGTTVQPAGSGTFIIQNNDGNGDEAPFNVPVVYQFNIPEIQVKL